MSAADPAESPGPAQRPMAQNAQNARQAQRGPLPQRLLMLFLAGWLLFDFPLLRLLLAPGRWWGLPRGPLLLFAAWALLIGVLAWWLESDGDES